MAHQRFLFGNSSSFVGSECAIVACESAADCVYAKASCDANLCNCPDGVCDIPGLGTHEGHEALRAAYARWTPKRPQRHLVVNTLVTDWSEDEARAISDVVFLLQGDAGWAIQVVGRYDDTLHNDNGSWRFHRRTATFQT